MRALRFTKSESTAYDNGERRFWRAMRKQPRVGIRGDSSIIHPEYLVWEDKGDIIPLTPTCMYRILQRCHYGTIGDDIAVKVWQGRLFNIHKITAISVEQRDGKRGWVVEVSA